MHICVIGAGAIGAMVAGYLNKAGVDVTLIGKNKDVTAITESGLVVDGVRGKMTLPVRVTSEVEKGADLIILAVKTQDIAATLRQNPEALKNTSVLTVENGVRAEELVAEIVPRENIISGIVMFGATYLEPGRITHNFEGDWIIGRTYAPNDPRITEIGNILGKAFSARITDKIRGMKWLKLFLNLNNCLPALTGKSMQETFARPEICRLSMRLWREALAVTDKAGIILESLPEFPVDRLRGLAGMPLDEASRIYSQIMAGLSREPLYGSVLQSIKRGRPSEIDYINGEIARLGDKTGTEATLNQRATEMIHDVERNGEFLTIKSVLDKLGR